MVTEEKGVKHQNSRRGTNFLTTKDTKGTKEMEDEALDRARKLGSCSS